MRKLPRELENPIDNIFIDIGDFLSPYFKKLNLTPNGLTTISLITGLLSIKYYSENKFILSAIYFIISYMFDCFDGFYARKYNMVSHFGDIYDHGKDIFIFIFLIYFIIKKYNKLKDWRKYLPYFSIILIITQSIQFGCQEIYYNKEGGNIIMKNFKKFCPIQNKNQIYNLLKILRFGGSGTTILYITLLILYSKNLDV